MKDIGKVLNVRPRSVMIIFWFTASVCLSLSYFVKRPDGLWPWSLGTISTVCGRVHRSPPHVWPRWQQSTFCYQRSCMTSKAFFLCHKSLTFWTMVIRAPGHCINSPPKSFSFLVTCITADIQKEAKPTFSLWSTPLGSAIITHLSVADGSKLKLDSQMSYRD